MVALPENVQLAPQTHAATLAGGNGSLTGTITDSSGAVVAGTAVRLLDQNGLQVASTFTDSTGNYSFSSLPPGTYRLESEHPGFKKTVMSQYGSESRWMKECGAPATSDNSTLFQSSPTVLSTMAQPSSSGFFSALLDKTMRYVVFQMGTSLM